MAHTIQRKWLRFKRHLQPTPRLRSRLTNGAWATPGRDTQAGFEAAHRDLDGTQVNR